MKRIEHPRLTPEQIEKIREAGRAGYLNHGGEGWDQLCDLAKQMAKIKASEPEAYLVSWYEDHAGSRKHVTAANLEPLPVYDPGTVQTLLKVIPLYDISQ